MFIQMDQRGYFNKGQIHIKATLESDEAKSILLQVSDKDTILVLKRKIGETMESNFELYRNLRNVQATTILKRTLNNIELRDDEIVENVLIDGEEVLF